MSELKAFDVGLGQYCEDGTPCVIAFDADRNPRLLNEQVYIKSEADKTIADLEESHKKEVEQLSIEIVKLKEERRWRKYPDEKPDTEVDECVCLLVVVEVQDNYNNRKYRYVTEAEYVLEDGEIPEGVFYRPYIGDEIEEDFVQANGKRYISKVIMWRNMPETPKEADK